MAAYNNPQIMPQPPPYHHNPQNVVPQYPPPPSSPRNTLEQHQLYPTTDPALQQPQKSQQPQQAQHQSNGKGPGHNSADSGGQGKARLRKACDSCSVRKVKCDESGPPCKACIGLSIPCTYERPTKRRGPPNRHAESLIKKSRMNSPGTSGHSAPSSPTHAAHTLASFAQHQVLSAESICPWSILQLLMDDYFTYIHPLIPLPHEPSFRVALQRREDMSNPTFLALLASMIGCLVASFPRKPRQHFRALNMEHLLPNSMSLVERCQKVADEVQSPGYLRQEKTVHDAVINYLQGITCAHTFNTDSCMFFMRQCMSICKHLGLHKGASTMNTGDGAPPPRMTPNGHYLQGPQATGPDLVMQEVGRRTFWVSFVGVRSLQQLGVLPDILDIPPATKAKPYPPLPVEVDDIFLTPHKILPQPPKILSELVGFNANVRVFLTYEPIAASEILYGVDELYDWERQEPSLEKCLRDVKRILEGVPPELSMSNQGLSNESHDSKYPSPAPASSTLQQQVSQYGADDFVTTFPERSKIQHEIQKANTYASHLGTRLYLVEKYWTLGDAHDHLVQSPQASNPDIAPLLDSYGPTNAPHASMSKADMANEHESIIRSFLAFLSSINQLNMEPHGLSFISRIRQIASMLLDVPRTQKGRVALRSDEYLERIVGVLMQLERIMPMEGAEGGNEEAHLRLWADLRECQANFARAGGVRD